MEGRISLLALLWIETSMTLCHPTVGGPLIVTTGLPILSLFVPPPLLYFPLFGGWCSRGLDGPPSASDDLSTRSISVLSLSFPLSFFLPLTLLVFHFECRNYPDRPSIWFSMLQIGRFHLVQQILRGGVSIFTFAFH